jgi:hypothetical protein
MRQFQLQPQPKQICAHHPPSQQQPPSSAIAQTTINSSASSSLSTRSTVSAPSHLGSSRNCNQSNSKIPQPSSSPMLSRTLRHSRSAPSLRALSPGPQQAAHIHSTPSLSAANPAGQASTGSNLRQGWWEKTVVELKAELRRRGLPTSGRKEEVLS